MAADLTAYAYDGLGNRIAQSLGTTSPTVTKYLLDIQPGLAVVLAETTGANVIRNVHAPRGIHAHKDASGAWEWMVQDGLGSVRGVVDNTVGALESRNYDPYGTEFGTTGSSQTAYGFTGEPTDDNGLLYLRARYYNPAVGVFTALDPFEGTAINSMSLNRYGYARGNPINYVDRSGMCPEATKEAVRQAVLVGKAAVPDFSIDGALPDTAANFVCAAQDFSGYAGQTVLVGGAAVEMAAQVVGVGVAATAALVLGTVSLGALIGLQIYLSATYAPLIYTPDLMDDLRPPVPPVTTPNPNVTVAPQPQPATSTPPASQPGLQPLPMPTETCAPTATATDEPDKRVAVRFVKKEDYESLQTGILPVFNFQIFATTPQYLLAQEVAQTGYLTPESIADDLGTSALRTEYFVSFFRRGLDNIPGIQIWRDDIKEIVWRTYNLPPPSDEQINLSGHIINTGVTRELMTAAYLTGLIALEA